MKTQPEVKAPHFPTDSEHRMVTEWGSAVVSTISEICGLHATDIEAIYPCTGMEEGLMALTARVPQAYVAHEVFKLPLDIDLERFKNAWSWFTRATLSYIQESV